MSISLEKRMVAEFLNFTCSWPLLFSNICVYCGSLRDLRDLWWVWEDIEAARWKSDELREYLSGVSVSELDQVPVCTRAYHKGHLLTSPVPFCPCCDDFLNRCQVHLVILCVCAFGNTNNYFLVGNGSTSQWFLFQSHGKGNLPTCIECCSKDPGILYHVVSFWGHFFF